MVFSLRTFTVIVDCLVSLLPVAFSSERGSPSDSTYRTPSEREAMTILAYIIRHNGAKAVEAGVVSRWLVGYPFGGPGVSLPQKWAIIVQISEKPLAYDDSVFGNAMSTILKEVFLDRSLSEEALKHKLLPRAMYTSQAWNHIPQGVMRPNAWSREMHQDPISLDDVFHDVPNDAIRTREGWVMPAGNRRREESVEERALRRRRREAVVVGRDDGQPIQSEDIFQRPAALVNEEIVEEDEELRNEEKKADQRTEGGWWELFSRLRPDGLAPVSS